MSFIPTAAIADKATFTEGTTGFVPGGGEFNDSSTTLTAGTVAAYRITEKRALHVNLRNETGTEMGTASNPLKVDGSGVTQPVSGTITANAGTGTFTTQDVADGATGSAVPTKGILVGGTDGTNLRALALDTSGRQKVLLFDGSGNSLSSTANGLKVDGSAVTQPVSGSVTVSGTVADSTLAAVISSGKVSVADASAESSLTTLAGTVASGKVSVSDALLEAVIKNGALQVNLGSMIQPTRTVTAATDTATLSDFLIECNATSNNIAESLPGSLTTSQTVVLVFKKIDSSTHTVTISGATIEQSSSLVLYQQNDFAMLQYDGTSWRVISSLISTPYTSGYVPTFAGGGSMTVSSQSLQGASQYIKINAVSAYFMTYYSFTLGGTAATTITCNAPLAGVGGITPIGAIALMPGGSGYVSLAAYVNGGTITITGPSGGNWTLGTNVQLMIFGTYRIV